MYCRSLEQILSSISHVGSRNVSVTATTFGSLVEHVGVVENLDGCDHDAVQFDLALHI